MTSGLFNSRRLWLDRFRAKCPRRIALRPGRSRKRALARQLFKPLLFVIVARQRREESDNVVNVSLRQGEWLHVFVEPGILQPVALVVVVHDIPKRHLRTVVKVGPRHQHVAQVRCLEGGNVSFLLCDEEAPRALMSVCSAARSMAAGSPESAPPGLRASSPGRPRTASYCRARSESSAHFFVQGDRGYLWKLACRL